MPYELRRNYCVNPSFEVNTNGWAAANGAVVSLDGTVWWNTGTKSMKIASNGGFTTTDVRDGSASTFPWSIPGGTLQGKDWTFSAYCHIDTVLTGSQAPDARGQRTNLYVSTDGSTFGTIVRGNQIPNTVNTTGRSVVTANIPSNCTGFIAMLGHGTSGLTDNVWFDSVMLEQSSSATPYFDGSTANTVYKTYSWDSTANFSQSVERSVLAGPADSYSLADIEYSYWKATSTLSSGSLADVKKKGMETALGVSGLSLADLELRYWKSLSGLSAGSVSDHLMKVTANNPRAYYAGFFK